MYALYIYFSDKRTAYSYMRIARITKISGSRKVFLMYFFSFCMCCGTFAVFLFYTTENQEKRMMKMIMIFVMLLENSTPVILLFLVEFSYSSNKSHQVRAIPMYGVIAIAAVFWTY